MRNLFISVTGLLPAFLWCLSHAPATADSYGELYERSHPSVALVEVRTPEFEGSASAFAVARSSGTVLATNHHVVDGATGLQVTFPGRPAAPATVIAMEPECDLALIRIPEPDVPTLRLAQPETLSDGMEVVALGYPLTDLMIGTELKCSIVRGLSNLRENRIAGPLLQTDLALNHGNSGGPILRTSDGAVVGVVSFGIREAEGLNFGIRVESLRKLLARSGVVLPTATSNSAPPGISPGLGSRKRSLSLSALLLPLALATCLVVVILALRRRHGGQRHTRPLPLLSFVEAGGRRYPVRVGAIFGRSDEADVKLDHASISRHHAVLVQNPAQGLILQDTGSKNGIWTEGNRQASILVTPGTRVRIGEVEGIFMVGP